MASLSISPILNLFNPLLPKPSNPSISLGLNTTHVAEKTQNKQSCFTGFSYLSKNGQIPEVVDLISDTPDNDILIGPEFYVKLLQRCVDEPDFSLGQQIHGLIIKKGDICARNEYIQTKLVIFYAKCDELECANRLFSRLCIKNAFSWAAMIGLNSRMGRNEQALLCYCEILENGNFPDNFVIPNALKACGAAQSLGFGKGIHAYVIKAGFEGCLYVASSLVDMYGKWGVPKDAEKVFDKMSERNVVVWNSMIVGYVQNGMNEEAIRLFYKMRFEGVEPSRITMSSLFSASANLGAVEEGRQGHALAIIYGFELGNVLGTSLVNFYSKTGWSEEAELVFTRIEEKDIVTWNLLISCYVQHGLAKKAVKTCHLMRLHGIRFDCVTMASLFSACADSDDIKLGKEAHCYCIRNCLDFDVVVAASMVNMYARNKEIIYARRVFDSSLGKDLVLWNAILAAYAELGFSNEALELFHQMQLQGFHPNVISWNSILLALLRDCLVDEAKNMFLQMRALGIEPNVVTWTTVITGLAQNGLAFEAMLLFQQMLESGIQPNTFSITALLSACIDMTSLLLGKAIHCYVMRRFHHFSIEISTSLVDMYAKCGSIVQAKRVFDMTLNKGLVLYNAMISAYGLHSRAIEALALYKHMKEECVEPNDVTFTSILSACSHEGLIDEGLVIFADMISMNKRPRKEHYGCLVTLLSRCGDLDEAIMVILNMPFEPDAEMFGSLLSACREQNLIELGEYISAYLLQLEPENTANYVALSNVCASDERWVKASEWRSLMKRKGFDKNPGCSWVQIGTESHVFVANDRSHHQKDEINMILALLEFDMRLKDKPFNLEIHSS